MNECFVRGNHQLHLALFRVHLYGRQNTYVTQEHGGDQVVDIRTRFNHLSGRVFNHVRVPFGNLLQLSLKTYQQVTLSITLFDRVGVHAEQTFVDDRLHHVDKLFGVLLLRFHHNTKVHITRRYVLHLPK